MPDIDIVDSTWICARPAVVAAVVADPANWRRWWPGLELVLDEWRGDKGVRWTVRRSAVGDTGSMEVWLEPAHDGVVAHYFLRLDAPGPGGMPRRRARRTEDVSRRRMKQVFWALADELDPGRIARISAPPES
jgi:hypothetical protein